jgi:flagellar biosynthesis anti-sigma factor FlgM
MNIPGNKPPDGQEVRLEPSKVQKTRGKDKTAGSRAALSTDKVSISGQGKKIAELMSIIDQLPEIRMDKVNEAKEAIIAGIYDADAQKIAQKLLDEL